MERITEKLLLEKGSPKTNEVEQIKTLSLFNMGLKPQDLPIKLLSRLRSLERLNLSANRLHQFPRNLELPALRYLDLSDNQFDDVTTLESLSSLEELKLEDNLYITVSDSHKLMVLLPKLKIYNGKDITSSANHVRFVYSHNLRTQIMALWEKNFCLPDAVTAEKMLALESKFVSTARQEVKFGPRSVSDFTKWRVEILAKEYLRSLTEPNKDPENQKCNDSTEKCEVSAPTKRKELDSPADTINLTPRKKRRTDPSTPLVEERPCRSSPHFKISATPEPKGKIRIIPRRASRPSSTPTGGAKRTEMAGRSSRVKETEENGARIKWEETSRRDAETLDTVKTGSKTQPVKLKPLHALQCHSKGDSSDDLSTQLWACAFQPLPHSSADAGGSRLVATCGGDSVCVIDCETGLVMKKYKVSGEEFFSLAWTTVLMSRGTKVSARQCNILAAGGKRGVVKLIHPRNNVAYGEFRVSKRALSVLRFNHQQGNFLYTGSYNNKIAMWDIGGVDSQYNFKVSQLLVFEISSLPLHLCLPPKSPGSHLLAACEDGLHCFNTQLGNNNGTKRSEEMEITFPIYKKEDKDHDYHTIDGLSFLNDDIVASKNYMHSCIYLWNWSSTKAQRPSKKTREVCAVVLAELQWASTEIPYLALNTCPGQAYIVCGDDKGRLWMYHITNLQKNSLQTGKPIQASEVLEWPTTKKYGIGKVAGPSINTVAMDPELQYLVALSDKNMVIVWRREASS
ncbi:leucine-rich repeat and WD repeat-containing protein 1 [Pholidichthys leucotaenia]